MPTQNAQNLANLLRSTNNVLIIAGGEPSVDTLGSALALSLVIQESGKRAQVVTPNPIRAEHSRLVGCDKVERAVTASRSFVITLPDAVDTIEKISCFAQEKTLNIVLQPYGDVQDFEPKDIQYSKANADYDCLILVDVPQKEAILSVFGEQAQAMADVPTIGIGRQVDQKLQQTLSQPSATATALVVLDLIQAMGSAVTADSANNLLQAIYEASDDFHAPTVTPEMFEVSALLLKAIKGEAPKSAPIAQRAMPDQRAMLSQLPSPVRQPAPPVAQAQPAIQTQRPPMPPRPNLQQQQPRPLATATSGEYEIDPFFEFDLPPDDAGFAELVTKNQQAQFEGQMPQREGFSQQTSPKPQNRPPMPGNFSGGHKPQDQGGRPQDRGQRQPFPRPGDRTQEARPRPTQNQQNPSGGEVQQPAVSQQPKQNHPDAPNDWLKPPKIYKSKTEDYL